MSNVLQKSIKIAIIGFGPAGMAAALQLNRFGLEMVVFDESDVGSLLVNAWNVENYLGIPEPMSGMELLDNFRQKLIRNNITPIKEKVLKLNFNEEEKTFLLESNKNVYTANYAIVASGTKPRTPSLLDKITPAIKKDIFFEVFPLFNENNKKIIIIGAGDAAFDFALNLNARGHDVCIVNHSDIVSALPLLQEKVFANNNIVYKTNLDLKDIKPGSERNLRCFFENRSAKTGGHIEIDHLLFAIGRVPRKDFYSKEFLAIENKLIADGLLSLAGDVNNGIYRQVAIATADGILAAMKINQEANNVRDS